MMPNPKLSGLYGKIVTFLFEYTIIDFQLLSISPPPFQKLRSSDDCTELIKFTFFLQN